MSALQAARAVGEEKFGMAMGLPEPAQNKEGCLGQGHKAVFVALGVTDVHAHARLINIADL